MDTPYWQFFIDVGGTFTDVVARRPDGTLVALKLLSSGAVRGVVGDGSTADCIRDARRISDPAGFWSGYDLNILNASGSIAAAVRVSGFHPGSGELLLAEPLPTEPPVGASYQLRSEEEAPVTAIRYLMGLRLTDPIGPVEVRLGTTRATNALLERKGAETTLVTTRGFADVLTIGNQDRPELFKLHVRKRDELATYVVEIDERITPTGEVLRPLDEARVRQQLERIADDPAQRAIAICLLHAHVNPRHEEMVASIAAKIGFAQVSVSSRVSRIERIVSRGDTTVVDAYLGPVIRKYVDAIRRSLPRARLMLMTSAGGLIDADQASGKDTLLSGPAGGVVGCAHVARQQLEAGEITGWKPVPQVIGFDMGGTSTDVSRIDLDAAGFEYQHETVKAGVRIVTPMLAVETVAAGGGSICAFDGQKLIVGPESAGADPGPACYGCGGPLAVTDMNVLLGRVPAAYFPFPLNVAAVEKALDDLGGRITAAAGSSLARVQLAEGFLRIANANMAAAIKCISIAKGYDLRTFSLVSFGGAGGQHACPVARMLGMTRIILSPFAGVLSALGIGAADIKRIGQRSVHVTLGPRSSDKLEPVFESITAQVREHLERDGIRAESLSSPVTSVDVCYAGEASLITVPAEPLSKVASRFEAAHRRLYGYAHKGRDVEIRVVRVELTSPAQRLPMPAAKPRTEPLRPTTTTRTIFEGKPHTVPVYLRKDLCAGDAFTGPVIVIEETSTVVVEPGWAAQVGHTGDLLLIDVQGAKQHEAVSTEADPIQLELFNNQFASIAEQMGTTLRRTALSTNVKERLDFSCAIFTPEGDLVVNAPHIPVHLGGMSDCVKALIEDVGTFDEGDVYITNDPYRGGSHLNDVTVVTPVHEEGSHRLETGATLEAGATREAERLLFLVASRAHHAEIGGTQPGSMPSDSTCLAEEGVLIRTFRWMSNGCPQSDKLRALLTAPPYPSRAPDENLADIEAQVAANQTGARELRLLIDRYGVEVVQAYMRHIQTAAGRKMRAALAKIPDGVHRFEDRLDDGSAISLAITIDDEKATFDFTGTAPVLPGNLNANRAIVASATLYCLRCLIDEDIPLNAGVLAPVRIILPACLLNPSAHPDPRQCPAIAGGNVETSQRVVDCILGALQVAAASQGTMNNVSLGNDRFGYYETICGGAGAGPGFAGASAVHTHMTNTRLTDPEVLESRYPVRLIRFAIRRGSGGTGQYNGGDGVVREIEFLEPLEVSIISQRRTVPPYGLGGAEPGDCGYNLLKRAGADDPIALPSVARVSVSPGDRLIIETPGGGGYGRMSNVE